jgi:hypothetical protein
MMTQLPPDQPSTTAPGPGGQSRCAPALLGLLGFILLVPGLCSVPVVLAMPGLLTARDAVMIAPLLIVFAILFAVGIRLIRKAFRTPAG